jgi:transcriptional regulator with PAS, ATPase and Fis domain
MADNYQIFADEWFNSKIPVQEILRQPKFANDKFAITLTSLLNIQELNDTNQTTKAFADAEYFDRLDFNPIAKMIFYIYWCHASMWKGLKKQTEIILEKAKRLNPPNAPPILLSNIKITVAYATGSGPAYMNQMMIEYKKYNSTTIKYTRILDNYILMKSNSGAAVSGLKSDNILEEYKNKISPARNIFFYHFLNDLGTCDFNSIQTYLHKINRNELELKVWSDLYDFFINEKTEFNLSLADTPYYKFFNAVLKANVYLKQSNGEGALVELNKIKNGIWDHVSSNFLAYTQIRVELANRNIEAAFQLLRAKISSGNHHYMDDFFLARVELLRNNKEKALLYFRKSYQQCEHYLALNRINIELDLAIEIKHSDLFYLAKIMEKKSTREQMDINYDEILSSEKLFGTNRLIGESDKIKTVKANVVSYAETNLPVLIIGETGAGKEVVARALHEESSRKAEPFLAINCGAIAESLLQSELFGHLAGAYTGAVGDHKGIFQEAGKGTVFLDEIGEISQGLQVALLRVLENNEVRPVGSSNQVPFHCRVIAATNANLELMVANKVFREDLYYRLKRLEIQIPPLRERKPDIISLVNYFLKSFRNSSDSPTLSDELMTALCEYDWPGNIRQLRNEIEKMDLLQSRKSHYELSDCAFLIEKLKINQTQETTKKVETPQELSSENAMTSWRRVEKIRGLFTQHKDLTRKEIAKKMQISLPTATNDLKKLLDEKFILKIEPSTSPRSHYFILNKESSRE